MGIADGSGGGNEDGDPLSSPFPIRSSARFLGLEVRPAISSLQREGLTICLSSSEGVDVEDKD